MKARAQDRQPPAGGGGGPTPSHVGTGTNGITTGGTLSLAYPAGVAAGDRMLVAIACRNSDVTLPAGWTLLQRWDTSNGNDFSNVFWKVAAGAETGNLDVTITGNSDCAGALSVFRDVGNVEASASAKETATTPSVAGTAGGLAVHVGTNAFTGTGFTGWAEGAVTLAGTFYETHSDSAVIVGFEALSTTGATTGRTPVGDDGSDDGVATVTFLPPA